MLSKLLISLNFNISSIAKSCGAQAKIKFRENANIVNIFTQKKGKLDGIAVRVPVLNASLTDCVFEIVEETSIEEINSKFNEAATSYLKGILGYEDRLLVSSDYVSDTRSSIVDAQSTMVNDKSQIKIISWYDNEAGYSNKLLDLAKHFCS